MLGKGLLLGVFCYAVYKTINTGSMSLIILSASGKDVEEISGQFLEVVLATLFTESGYLDYGMYEG